MRIISKRFATGILGTILSVIPMAQAGAQKAATSSTKFHSSKVLAAAGEHLKGAAKDTYKFSATSSKKATKSNVSNELRGIKNLVTAPAIAPKGARLIKETQKARFYALDNKALSNLLGDVENQLDTASIDEIAIKVPKTQVNGNRNFRNLLSRCSIKKQYKPQWSKDTNGKDIKSTFITYLTGEKTMSTKLVQTDITSDGSYKAQNYFYKLGKGEDGTSKVDAAVAFSETHDGPGEISFDGKVYVFDFAQNTYRSAGSDEYGSAWNAIMDPIEDLRELEIPKLKTPRKKISRQSQQEQQQILQTQIMMQQQTMMFQNQLFQQRMLDQQTDLINTLDMQRRNLENKQIQETIQHNIDNANAANAPTYGTR